MIELNLLVGPFVLLLDVGSYSAECNLIFIYFFHKIRFADSSASIDGYKF